MSRLPHASVSANTVVSAESEVGARTSASVTCSPPDHVDKLLDLCAQPVWILADELHEELAHIRQLAFARGYSNKWHFRTAARAFSARRT